MKKITLLIFLMSSFAQAQFSINGTFTNSLETDWVILYRIEGSKLKFVQNTTIKKDTLLIEGKNQIIGSFQFTLPKTAKVSSYRVSYRTNDASFLDFLFNKENISFTFHADYPGQTVLFSASKENIIYRDYLNEVFKQQEKLDSLQIKAIVNPEIDLKQRYNTTFEKINKIQQKYLESTKEMYVHPFIKASLRVNSKEIKTNAKEYTSSMHTNFFNHIDFSNEALINSSFLVDRVKDYVFYLNYSENTETQKELYKTAIATVFTKVENIIFKKNVIEFLIDQFEQTKNLEIIDFLFENYYNKLPKPLQNATYKNEKLKLLATEVGRIAPNFSWKEKGKTFQLSTLKGVKNYVLVFWSTSCSHCLKEIPELHNFSQDKKDIKVVAFAMEKNNLSWSSLKITLPNWHHVLGLNKWENKTARTYNIYATPTYFVLDENKKIIAKPNNLEELKTILKK